MGYFLLTKRLGFRTWSQQDYPLAAALWQDSDVTRYLSGVYSDQQVQERLDLEKHHQATYGFQYWPIFTLDQGRHVGCAGLRPFHNQIRTWELGVHIHRVFWGSAMGEEAARGVIGYAFHTLQAQTLVAGHNPANNNSRQLILKLGFHFTHEEPWGPRQQLHPMYALQPDAYQPAHDR